MLKRSDAPICKVIKIILLFLLIPCIFISIFCFVLSSYDANTFSGWHYDNICSEKSDDKSMKIDIMVRDTYDNAFLPHDHWYIVKIIVTDTKHQYVLSEYEGTSLSHFENNLSPIVEWDKENGTVSVSFDDNGMPKITLSCKYDCFPISQENMAKDYIGFMMISGFALVILVLLFVILMFSLYLSDCRKKYIEKTQTETGETD